MCLNPFFVSYHYDAGCNKYILDFKKGGLLRTPGDKAFKFRCRNCPECWIQDTTEWAVRCSLEAKEHAQNCVLTLTYADAGDGELYKRDYQLFLKRLRKKLGDTRIKYFVSGEYGSLKGRPHFHMPIFGWSPEDAVFFKKSKSGTLLFNSAFLDELWSHGYVTVDINPDYKSYFYSAKYMQKAVEKYGSKHKQPPFIAMSKGIAEKAADVFDPYKQNFIYLFGRKYYIPRYFFKRYAKRLGNLALETFRAFQSQMFPKYDLLNLPLYRRDLIQKFARKKEERLRSNENKFKIFLKKCNILS